MKKMTKLAAVALGVMMIAMMLMGCGGKDMSASKFCGTWTATTAEYSGVEMNVTDIFGGDMILTLGEDGKCTFDVAGESESGKWEEVDGTVVIDGDEDLKFSDNDGKLTLDYDDVIINFEK